MNRLTDFPSLLPLRQDHQHLLDRRRRGLLHDEVRPPAAPPFAFAGDSAEPHQEMTCDRLRFLAGQRDPELLLEIVQSQGAVEEETALAGRLETGALLLVVLVFDG